MKFTSEDLMKAMGLKVGDRVVCLDSRYIFMVREYRGNVYLECENADLETQFIHYLLNVDFEILPAPKRVGDLKCKDFECSQCPIRALINCNKADNQNRNLFDNLAEWNSTYTSFDQEIYDLLMARLDKEVKENVDNESN